MSYNERMCAVCSGFNIPICSSGVICTANFHEMISFALLSGSTLFGSIIGVFRFKKDSYDKKK